jgi:hypothetical protein
MQAHALIYKCPHCGTPHEVEPHRDGEVLNCTRCAKPFQLEIPSAHPEAAEGRPPSLIVPAEGKAPAPAATEPGSDVGRDETERTVATARPSIVRRFPGRFFGYLAMALVGVYFFVVCLVNEWWPFVFLSGLVGGFGLFNLIYWWMRIRATTVTVTNHRTVVAKGLINKEAVEVAHKDLEHLEVHQNWIQRLLGVGDLDLYTQGEAKKTVYILGLPRPAEMANQIRAQHPDARQQPAPQAAGNAVQVSG